MPRDTFQKCFKFFRLNLAAMLANLRNFSFRSLRPWSIASGSRALSLSAVRQQDKHQQTAEYEQYESDERQPHPEEQWSEPGFGPDEKGYAAWLSSEGAQFRVAHRPRNWLGGSTTVRVFYFPFSTCLTSLAAFPA